MKWKLFISLVFVSTFVYAQPTIENIRKFKISKWIEKRSGESSAAEKIIWYDRQGNDSVIQNGDLLTIYKNDYKNGRLMKKTEVPAGGIEGDIYEYEYAANGSYKETYTDGDFKMKSYEWYDGKGKLLRSQSPDGNTTTYKYDAKGKLVTVTSDGKNAGVKINHKYSYNTKGQLIKLERNVDGTKSTTTYQYDNKGRLIKQIDKGGWEGEDAETETVFEYNNKGLVSKSTVRPKGSSEPGNEFEYEYEYYK